ncbi:hypothetical protein O181_053835 [Austropuccinia psidii MF-1]|uniref:Uncharacterized protein n=1 Tax=Austropuccinia psidii MF-1 TaxID=1389203 RepID=A0A9Q3HTU7_9BASI|nr:hypothetical protein [Austropuccinia psidii MF-1]
MPIRHSPPERQTMSQARTHAVLTPTPNFTLDGIPEVPQLSNESPIRPRRNHPGRKTTLKGSDEHEDNHGEEEEPDGNEPSLLL